MGWQGRRRAGGGSPERDRCESPSWGTPPLPVGVSGLCPPQVRCCGWASFYNWTDNAELMNRTNVTYPCSCEDKREADDSFLVRKGFCEAFNSTRTESGNNPEYWPVYREVCARPEWGWGGGVGGTCAFRYSGPSASPPFFPPLHPEPLSAGPLGWGGPSWASASMGQGVT